MLVIFPPAVRGLVYFRPKAHDILVVVVEEEEEEEERAVILIVVKG